MRDDPRRAGACGVPAARTCARAADNHPDTSLLCVDHINAIGAFAYLHAAPASLAIVQRVWLSASGPRLTVRSCSCDHFTFVQLQKARPNRVRMTACAPACSCARRLWLAGFAATQTSYRLLVAHRKGAEGDILYVLIPRQSQMFPHTRHMCALTLLSLPSLRLIMHPPGPHSVWPRTTKTARLPFLEASRPFLEVY